MLFSFLYLNYIVYWVKLRFDDYIQSENTFSLSEQGLQGPRVCLHSIVFFFCYYFGHLIMNKVM